MIVLLAFIATVLGLRIVLQLSQNFVAGFRSARAERPLETYNLPSPRFSHGLLPLSVPAALFAAINASGQPLWLIAPYVLVIGFGLGARAATERQTTVHEA